MRLLYLLVAVPAILAIPSQVLALAPKKINWSSHGRKLTAREIFKRARPSYEGRLLGVIGDYHLNGMLQHPLLPSPADGRRDTVIVLDPTTCTGKYRKATRLALEGAEELALIASDAALQGSEKLFEEFFGTTDKSIRAKVAARFQSIAANAHVTSAGKKSPRIPIKYYCQGGPDYEFLTGRPDPCAAAPGAHAITRNSNHIVNVSFPISVRSLCY